MWHHFEQKRYFSRKHLKRRTHIEGVGPFNKAKHIIEITYILPKMESDFYMLDIEKKSLGTTK
ncbi:hypothetical protein COL78_28780 [Bacillus wiedmannii]|nr:hypothetical protein COL78_28780 [Bacillus wiedmannii]